MLAFTTGGPLAMYGPTGLNGDARVVLWPLENGVLNFVGYDVLPHFQAPGPARADAATRAAMLDAWAERLLALDRTPKLVFHHLDEFDEAAGWALRPGIRGRTVGQPGEAQL